MAKTVTKVPTDLTGAGQSVFTLTFAIEILGVDVLQDSTVGWLDLGPCTQGVKIQYQLYPGQNFDIDILIWPHVAKIWSGMNSGWVRTWQFIDRCWLTFDISHIFPVRAVELQAHVATITPVVGLGALGANAKNDKVQEVYLPRLEFGQRRYFAPVILKDESSLETFMYDLIWQSVEGYIPASYLDGLFDVPYPVTDVRHQDAVLYHVKESSLSRSSLNDSDQGLEDGTRVTRQLSTQNQKKKIEVTKFEILLSGDKILAGTGRQVPFEILGERPPDMGEFIVFISSQNLPAHDDSPIFFINIDSLFDVPIEELKKYQISHIYTQWSMGEEVHDSEPLLIQNKKTMTFNDHHALPMPCDTTFKIISGLMDDYFRIQLRGIRQAPKASIPKFFGYDKRDHVFGTNFPPKIKSYEVDIIIATTKINARSLAKGLSGVIKGEFALFPPDTSVASLGRETFCTNDENGIKIPVIPEQVIPSYVILDAQMTLQLRMGYAGCRPRRLERSYSRMMSLITNSWLVMEMLQLVNELNHELGQDNRLEELLTGFAADTGDTVIFYVEGPKDGAILHLWEKTEDFHPHSIPTFSSSARFPSRIYPVSSSASLAVPFMVMKMYVPLSAVLACPLVYAKPVLPVLTRYAALKLGRLVASKQRWLVSPPSSEMPTLAELVSFREELCVAPRPPDVLHCSVLMKGLPVKKGLLCDNDSRFQGKD